MRTNTSMPVDWLRKDLARPGGNVTGFANFQPSMGGKWLEKLREIAPQIERIGLLMRPEPPNVGYLRSAEAAASSFKIKLVGLEAQSSSEIDRAIADIRGRAPWWPNHRTERC